MCRSAINGKHAPGKTRVFLEFKGFIVRGTARRIEKKKPEGVSWPAIVKEEFLKAGFLHFGLFVGRGGRRRRPIMGIAQPRMIWFGAPQNGIDQRRSGWPEIQRGEGPAVGGLH